MRTEQTPSRTGAPRRGHVLVLVLVAVSVALELGLGFLARASTTTHIAVNIADHAVSRQIAETGLAVGIAYLEKHPNWHEQLSDGVWINNQAMFDGTLTLRGHFTPQAIPTPAAVADPSFEMQTASLPTPLLFPPTSGTIGDWEVRRNALGGPITGLTVPHIGAAGTAQATHGGNVAFIRFPVSVTGTASFRQTLDTSALPNSRYLLGVNVGRAGLAAVLAEYEVRLYAGDTLVASSGDTQFLTLLQLSGDWRRHLLTAITGDTPPSGNLRIELHAKSLLGVLSAVAFDEVVLVREPTELVTLTAVGRYRETSHVVRTDVLVRLPPLPVELVRWHEP